MVEGLEFLRDLVWGLPLIIALAATGLYLTILLRGLQFRRLIHALKLALFQRDEPEGAGDISHFQSLMTALGTSVGTANIVGVATAITAGGAGALFWMWVAAFRRDGNEVLGSRPGSPVSRDGQPWREVRWSDGVPGERDPLGAPRSRAGTLLRVFRLDRSLRYRQWRSVAGDRRGGKQRDRAAQGSASERSQPCWRGP